MSILKTIGVYFSTSVAADYVLLLIDRFAGLGKRRRRHSGGPHKRRPYKSRRTNRSEWRAARIK